MEIREFREGDVLVLAPDGSIAGIEETSAIETRLVASLKAGFQLLVLDCAAAGELTSAAIRVLLLTSRKLERTDGRLVLCGMNAKLRKAFSISGFDKDFTIAATRQEALQRVLEPVPPRPPRKEREKEKEKAPAPEAVVSAEAPALPETDADQTPVVVSGGPAALAHPAAVVESASPVPVVLTEPSSPATDVRDAIATALLDALGVSVAGRNAARSSRAASSDLDSLATRLLAVLRVARS